MIAPMVLSDSFDARASLPPFFGDEATATICGCFFKTGCFGNHKATQSREHVWQARLEKAQEFFWEVEIRHGADMLATRRKSGNLASARQRPPYSLRSCEGGS